MLSQTHPLKRICAAVLATLAVGIALPAVAEDAPVKLELPPGMGESITQEQIREAQTIGAEAVRNILEAYNARGAEEDAFAAKTRRRVDTIADEAMEADRNAILDFLGIDPAAETSLYFFVSWSMPLEMLRSYAVEAMWSGATLVFKGVPPGKELATFITQDLRQLVYGKGAAANISIDPRLYDAYEIKSVPSIVFTRVRQDIQCQGIAPVEVKVSGGRVASYDTCPALDPSNYWKISGAVTANYALQSFIDDGASDAAPHLRALSRGWSGGVAPSKEQKLFVGKWDDVLSPSEQKAAQEAANAITGATQQK